MTIKCLESSNWQSKKSFLSFIFKNTNKSQLLIIWVLLSYVYTFFQKFLIFKKSLPWVLSVADHEFGIIFEKFWTLILHRFKIFNFFIYVFLHFSLILALFCDALPRFPPHINVKRRNQKDKIPSSEFCTKIFFHFSCQF